jgi:hypothetical protein
MERDWALNFIIPNLAKLGRAPNDFSANLKSELCLPLWSSVM